MRLLPTPSFVAPISARWLRKHSSLSTGIFAIALRAFSVDPPKVYTSIKGTIGFQSSICSAACFDIEAFRHRDDLVKIQSIQYLNLIGLIAPALFEFFGSPSSDRILYMVSYIVLTPSFVFPKVLWIGPFFIFFCFHPPRLHLHISPKCGLPDIRC